MKPAFFRGDAQEISGLFLLTCLKLRHPSRKLHVESATYLLVPRVQILCVLEEAGSLWRMGAGSPFSLCDRDMEMRHLQQQVLVKAL